MLLAVGVGERDQLPEQQGVLEHPLHRLDQVGLQGGGVLLGGVPGVQEFLEGLIGLGWKTNGVPSVPNQLSGKGDDLFSEGSH